MVKSSFMVLLLGFISACGGGNNSPMSPGVSPVSLSLTPSGDGIIYGRGNTYDFKSNVDLSNGSRGNDVTNQSLWSSSNPGVATVDNSGKVIALAYGSTTITAKYQNLQASKQVTVSSRITFTAESRGFNTPESPYLAFLSSARFIYSNYGAQSRGFNIAAIELPSTKLLGDVQHFDTWANILQAAPQMVSYLNSLPQGTLLLFAVSDEAGITYNSLDACGAQGWDPVPVLRALGATKINGYCFRDSWSMIAIKGVGVKDEQIAHTSPAISSFVYDIP